MKSLTKFSMWVLCVALAACSGDVSMDGDAGDDFGRGIVPVNRDGKVAVDTKIVITPVESIGGKPRTFLFDCKTEEIYPCINFPIVVETALTGDVIDIRFKGVVEMDICFTAVGPAQARVDLGSLAEGSYNLVLRNGKTVRVGKLIVAAENYTVKMEEDDIFGFTNPVLGRIPAGTIWGLVGYHKEETGALVDAFLGDLVAIGAVEKAFTPGEYNAFLVDGNGKIISHPDALYGYWFDRLFLFEYTGDTVKIDDLVARYARDHNAELSIWVYTDTGEQFLSWMYGRQ